jgi:hypothetical protein
LLFVFSALAIEPTVLIRNLVRIGGLDEEEGEGGDGGGAHDDVGGGVDALEGECVAPVPSEVAKAVEAVEAEGEGEGDLDGGLEPDGERCDKVGQACTRKRLCRSKERVPRISSKVRIQNCSPRSKQIKVVLVNWDGGGGCFGEVEGGYLRTERPVPVIRLMMERYQVIWGW